MFQALIGGTDFFRLFLKRQANRSRCKQFEEGKRKLRASVSLSNGLNPNRHLSRKM
jgi:hypothetical protein